MIKRTEWKMELLDDYNWRIQVIGGWIVYSQSNSNKGHVALTSVFVADPHHQWVIIKSKYVDLTRVKPAIPECLL